MQLNLDLSQLHNIINDSFYPLLVDKSRYEVFLGGAGSGKSWFIAQKFLLRILLGMRKGIKHRILALRKTSPACKKSVFTLFKDLIYQWNIKDIVDINHSDLTFKFINDSEIMCGGMDDEAKIKSIAGLTSAWLEESTEFNVGDFIQLDLRIRGQTPSYKQICLSCNPISKLSWVYETFFQKQKESCNIHLSTYNDNRFLDNVYKKVLEGLKEQDENLYSIYAKGMWGQLLDLIYQNWTIVEDKNWPTKFKETCYGIDFGFVAPTGVVEVSIKDNEFYIKEILYEKKLTNQDLIGKLEDIIPESKRDRDCIFCDSAEPQRIEEIQRAGFFARSSNKDVNLGIDFCKRHKLYIHESSINLIKELQTYSYKKDKNGNVIEEPVKFADHLLDPMRYALFTNWGKGEDKLEIVF
jgi:phage terminase large subunit